MTVAGIAARGGAGHRSGRARRRIAIALSGLVMIVAALWSAPPARAAGFDHDYAAFGRLLQEHVHWIDGGVASQVDYAGFKRDRAAFDAVLAGFSAVSPDEFESFDRDQRLAFLINAYNAFTIALILTEYPGIDSIKDLGGFFSSPWKKSFFTLLGQERTLDWIEHERIRAPGVYDEPRIHFVVNCASIGCPALRPDPLRARELGSQLQDSLERFLSDRTRNRYDARADELQVSKIFDWYGGDFEKGHQGIDSLRSLFAAHAERLADDESARERIRNGSVDIDFLDYDWSLNRAP